MTSETAAIKYGSIIDGKWENENKYMVLFDVSHFDFPWINTATGKKPDHIYCNKDLGGPLFIALSLVVTRGFAEELVSFDGCWMIRRIRGVDDTWSMHSWGLAIDLNAKQNPLGGPVMFTEGFRKCFIDSGFKCGADFHRVDGMHFELA